MTTLDIICLGEPLLEFNQERADGPHYRKGYGGDTSNAAIAAARQGARVAYLTALGIDAFADELLALWATEGVDAGHVRRDPEAHTGLYFVSHGAHGHSFTYMRAGSAASRMTPALLPDGFVASARYLHLSGISQAISASACDTAFAAIGQARSAGTAVSFDTNLRLKLWPLARARAVIHATVPQVDILLPSLEDATALTGQEKPDAIADLYLEMGAPLVVLKMGSDGALVATAERREHVHGHPVTVVDATGAGDTFDGAFLAEMACGASPFEAARYANTAAALSTQGYGAVAPIPRRAEVEAFRKDRGTDA